MINLLSQGTITSGFGMRDAPTNGASTNHKGIDIVLNSDAVPSVLGGTVSYVGYSNSAGNMITIEHADGSKATYMHLSTLPQLRIGEYVEEGTMIGSQGSTGISTGKHLHFQVEKDSEYIDPQTWFNEYGSISAGLSNVKNNALGFVGHIIEFVVILLILVLAVVLFMKAFDISIK